MLGVSADDKHCVTVDGKVERSWSQLDGPFVLPTIELTLPDRVCKGECEFEKGNVSGR